jgi:response regulator RpfG family c-di-GMP phosphodiesterase
LNLPDGNGLNLLNLIRSRGIPVAVVVVTGRSDETTVVAALKAGADDYVVKREDYLERLPVTLENALTRFRAESALHSRSLRVLKGVEIPLSARIFAVVDVWDALRSDRSYRTSWEREKVLAYIKEQSGLHFDPGVVRFSFRWWKTKELNSQASESPKRAAPVV